MLVYVYVPTWMIIRGEIAESSNSNNSQKKSVPQERREGLSIVTLQDYVDVATS